MREITSHKVNGLNEKIAIYAPYGPAEEASHPDYRILVATKQGSMSEVLESKTLEIQFQKGPIKEAGVNGISIEALLAVSLDRLQSFQTESLANRYNAEAIKKIQEAMMWLHLRTHERMQRGVEGTNQK